MSDYTVIHDALPEGEWFRNLSPRLADAELSHLDDDAPRAVLEIVSYDRPDIVLLREGEPVLVVEKTGHVPTGKNPLQRVARLVKAAETGIPSVLFIPTAARKHGENASKTNLNHRAIQTLRRIEELTGTPMLLVPWPTDEDHELRHDGSEDERLAAFVDQFLAAGCDPAVPAADETRVAAEREAERILSEYAAYQQPPGSVGIRPTGDVVDSFGVPSGGTFSPERDESVVCRFGFRTRRTDPYVGAQFAYDYLYCRRGPTIHDRERNLVLHMPELDRETWFDYHPYRPGNKTALWYACADALALADDVLVDFERFREADQGRLDEFR